MSLFISFEGGEGTGKSTQVQLLFERLKGHGYSVVVVHEPGGTELAGKSEFSPSKGATEPDPSGRIDRDESPLIDIQTTVVPAEVKPGQTARVHVVMRPNKTSRGHWNNESGELAFWIDPPNGWEVDQRRLLQSKRKAKVYRKGKKRKAVLGLGGPGNRQVPKSRGNQEAQDRDV